MKFFRKLYGLHKIASGDNVISIGIDTTGIATSVINCLYLGDIAADDSEFNFF